jgi:hypothetical protein
VDERRVEAALLAGEQVGRAGQLGPAEQVGVAERVRQPARVREQVADRGGVRGRAQPRLVAVEALEDPELAELRQDRRDRLVQVEPALLDELHRRHARQRLRHRRNAEHRLGDDRIVALDAQPSRVALVADAVGARRDRGDAGNGAAVRRLLQQLVHVPDATAFAASRDGALARRSGTAGCR